MSTLKVNNIQSVTDGTVSFPQGLSSSNQPISIPDGTASSPSIRFASDTNTGIFRSASDQIDIVTGGDSRFRIESTGQIKAVYESQVGTDYNTQLDNGYLCRAWVNFNGTGTVAIRASGNVSSITDRGIGLYTINLTTALPDTNYCGIANSGDLNNATITNRAALITAINTSSAYVNSFSCSTGGPLDVDNINAVIFR